MDVRTILRERLAGHNCYEGCDNLLCLSNREIIRLRDEIGLLQMFVCPHREILDDGREAEGESVQCAKCAGIIHQPELLALRRAERAEALIREGLRLLDASEQWTEDWHAANESSVAAWRALLADLDAREKATR